MGRASAISSAGRQVGASFGVALLATVLTSRLTAHDTSLAPGANTAATIDAFHEAFFVAAVLTLVGAGCPLLDQRQRRGGYDAPSGGSRDCGRAGDGRRRELASAARRGSGPALAPGLDHEVIGGIAEADEHRLLDID